MASCRAFLRLGGGPERDRDPVTRTGRDGWIEVVAWRHAVDSPRGSAAKQLPSGESADEPLVIAKPVDEASRRLIAARRDDEVFAEAWLEIWRPTPPGPDRRRPSREELLDMPREEALERVLVWLSRRRAREELDYTIHLHNARVGRIETEMLAPDSAASFPGPIEWVHIAYEKISWSWGPVSVAITIRREEEKSTADAEATEDAVIAVSGRVEVTDRLGKPVERATVKGCLISGDNKKPVQGSTDESGVFNLEQGFAAAVDTVHLEVTEVVGFDRGTWKSATIELPKAPRVEVGPSTSAIFEKSKKQKWADLVRAAAAKLQFVDGKSEYTSGQIWAEIQTVGPPYNTPAYKRKLEDSVGGYLKSVSIGRPTPPRYTLIGKIWKAKSDHAKLAKIVDELRNALA